MLKESGGHDPTLPSLDTEDGNVDDRPIAKSEPLGKADLAKGGRGRFHSKRGK